ncbi:MAG: hypothetical protein ACI9WO_002313 [Sphingobacteriales bacterium]|jgi:hypothetical protein
MEEGVSGKCISCFLEHPYYGVERMTDYLNKYLGYRVNVKRVRRLYEIMGLNTIYCKPRTTILLQKFPNQLLHLHFCDFGIVLGFIVVLLGIL